MTNDEEDMAASPDILLPVLETETSGYIVHTWKLTNFRHMGKRVNVESPTLSLDGKQYRITLRSTDKELSVSVTAIPGASDWALSSWRRSAETVVKLRGVSNKKEKTVSTGGLQRLVWTGLDETPCTTEAFSTPFCNLWEELETDELTVLTKVFCNDEDMSKTEESSSPAGPAIGDRTMDDLFEDTSFADVRLQIGPCEIFANRAILAMRSHYFRRLFSKVSPVVGISHSMETDEEAENEIMRSIKMESTGDSVNSSNAMSESAPVPSAHQVIAVDYPDLWAFRVLIRFLYTEKIERCVEDPFCSDEIDAVERVMRVADSYGCHSLRERAVRQLLENMTPDTAVRFLFKFGGTSPHLRSRFMNYVVEHFAQIKSSDTFKAILANSASYPDFSEIMVEILERT
ncbi:hypothetical protein DFJ77DRAFT_444345 [Powellomyces hirtus]|nr:hypothetical protein DFJ77DRAFT_444345 [Powellomyces hirtus]